MKKVIPCFFSYFYKAFFTFPLFSCGFCAIFNENVIHRILRGPCYLLKIRFDFHKEIKASIKKSRILNFSAEDLRNSSLKSFLFKGVFRNHSNINDGLFCEISYCFLPRRIVGKKLRHRCSTFYQNTFEDIKSVNSNVVAIFVIPLFIN